MPLRLFATILNYFPVDLLHAGRTVRHSDSSASAQQNFQVLRGVENCLFLRDFFSSSWKRKMFLIRDQRYNQFRCTNKIYVELRTLGSLTCCIIADN